MTLPRRALLRIAMGAAAPSAHAQVNGAMAGATAPQLPSLSEVAGRAGLRFGSDSDVEIATAPPDYSAIFLRNCDLLAPQVSWARLSPTQFDVKPAWEDPNIVFARAHGIKLTGGHLLWHENLPSWFSELESRSDAVQAVERHINATTRFYQPLIYSWNVVNEAIEPKDGRSDGLRNSPLLHSLGSEYIALAFHLARNAAPGAHLVYNDYGMEMARPDQEARRTALLKLLDRLAYAQAPIDAVGLQSHLRLDGSRFDTKRYTRFLQELASRKLSIIISELDVFDGDSTSDIAVRDDAVAALYSEFLDTALDEQGVVAVVTWGLADRYTWLNNRPDLRRAGPVDRLARPLLFDTLLRPKPAFYAVLSALNHASRRQPL